MDKLRGCISRTHVYHIVLFYLDNQTTIIVAINLYIFTKTNDPKTFLRIDVNAVSYIRLLKLAWPLLHETKHL